ncbi:uncharacterized protein CLUP02_14801 [Colletotrichum lupini]|uniref:Uncharacterized protein n=1 Tax=Colletotrichum lupini TaxID=145971 RepID=A0A9Q8WNE6_9PEZI|nr:uncharacterized protein CLUP02_14801 [Colletotrichum lupini]UQC89272.1 hypothetical protein CLUP02_14801 [Colletotrichum lupini]
MRQYANAQDWRWLSCFPEIGAGATDKFWALGGPKDSGYREDRGGSNNNGSLVLKWINNENSSFQPYNRTCVASLYLRFPLHHPRDTALSFPEEKFPEEKFPRKIHQAIRNAWFMSGHADSSHDNTSVCQVPMNDSNRVSRNETGFYLIPDGSLVTIKSYRFQLRVYRYSCPSDRIFSRAWVGENATPLTPDILGCYARRPSRSTGKLQITHTDESHFQRTITKYFHSKVTRKQAGSCTFNSTAQYYLIAVQLKQDVKDHALGIFLFTQPVCHISPIPTLVQQLATLRPALKIVHLFHRLPRRMTCPGELMKVWLCLGVGHQDHRYQPEDHKMSSHSSAATTPEWMITYTALMNIWTPSMARFDLTTS